jgi:hypothetical protein
MKHNHFGEVFIPETCEACRLGVDAGAVLTPAQSWKWVRRGTKTPSLYSESSLQFVLDAHELYAGAELPWFWSVVRFNDLNRELSSGVALTQEKAQRAAEAAAEAMTR